MVTRTRLRSILTICTLYLGAFLVIGYFAFHAYTGDRGLKAKADIEAELAELSRELATLKAERAEWDHRVGLLKSVQLDPDMLGEQARVQLGYAHPDDVILVLPQR
jgi:cell division protein FtsB